MVRVVDLIRGRYGILREARVILGKTRAIIGRPLNKLCRLELASGDEISTTSGNSRKVDNGQPGGE